jgi:uncharacterized protein (UPF0297 family)
MNEIDINLTGPIAANLAANLNQPWYNPILNNQLLGVVLGGLIASITSYVLDRNKERHEYQKDLAEAVRKAYSNFLSLTFKGVDEKTDMATYLRKLREAYGPVFLLGSEKIVKAIGIVLNEAQDVWYKSGEMSEKERSEYIANLMARHGEELFGLMYEDVREGPDYQKIKHWWQFQK